MSLTLTRNPNPDTSPNDGAPGEGDSSLPPDDNPRDMRRELDKEEIFRRVVTWFKSSRDHYKEWRQEAADCYDYTAGYQWSDEDKQILADQGRPAVTFNRIGPFVDGVSGLEIGNRQTTNYLPRTLGKSGVNELLTSAAQWVRDECDAEDEESEMVRDCIICGIGCAQTRMDYDEDPDGMIRIERVDPLEKYPDPSSRKPNFADARFDIRCKDVPIPVAEEMFPEFPPIDLHARWAEDEPDEARQPHNARLAPYYRIDQAGDTDRQQQQCRLVEVEWWDYVTAYRVVDPQTGRLTMMSAEEAGRYRIRARALGLLRPVMIKIRKKRYYKAIVGNIVLKVMRGADEGGFSYKYVTGKRDRNKGWWYGLVRAMRDPQMWANKFFAQSLHIVNVNAKGGLLAETDAFVDIEEARDAWADSDSIVELNPGGLGKVQQKQPPQFPIQINQMMQMALDAIPATAGVNLEMIAQQTKEQAGVLEMQRKQQGMTVLAYIFNAKRLYQKEQGRLMLWMIQTFIADGRLIRIGGAEDAQFVPLIHTPGLAEYDVIVDEAPTSPNMKERVWSMIVQMFPMLKSAGIPPQATLEFMKYAPFPASLMEKVSQMMQNQPPPSPDVQARTALDQAKAAHTHAEAAHTQAETARLQAETSLMPIKAQGEEEERYARVRNLLAQALNQLQDAGMAPDIQAVERAKLRMDQDDQIHQHAMDQAEHVLEMVKALPPPGLRPPAPGGGAPGSPSPLSGGPGAAPAPGGPPPGAPMGGVPPMGQAPPPRLPMAMTPTR